MLGARIALLRRSKGLSQRALAAALDVSPSAVGMYEQERRIPSTDLLVEMAELFGVSTDFLLTGCSRPADGPCLQALLKEFRACVTDQRGASPEKQDAALLLTAILCGGELTQEEKSAIIDPLGGEAVTDEEFMQEALRLAREAAEEGEVPVGCVITDGETIVGRGRNRRERGKNALAHAELEAIDQACRTLGGWRLWRCTLYVTLEPCPMCAGAIINARIPRVVYGARDLKCGAAGSVCDLFSMDFNHHPQAQGGVREAEAAALLQEFFRELRVRVRQRPKWKKPE